MQKWIRIALGMLIVAFSLIVPSLTYANAIFNIVPDTNAITIYTTGTISYTATNNTEHSVIRNITVEPGYNISGYPIGLTLQENTCAGISLASGASCTFKVLLTKNSEQRNSFLLMPRVCGYSGAICSVPVESNRVRVTVVPVPPSPKIISEFSINGTAGIISGNTITVNLPVATNRSSLVAVFTSSEGSTVFVNGVLQESGVTANNFTNPVIYTVRGADGTTATYTVQVTAPPSDNTISSFSLNGIAGVIAGNTITVTVPFGNDVTALIATFGTAAGSTTTVNGVVQESSITPNNFTTPLTYTVTGVDTSSSTYVVTVAFFPQTGQLTPLSIPTIPTNASPGDIIMSPNGNFLYGNNGALDEVGQYSINTTNGELSRLSPYSVATGDNPFTIALTPNGDYAYVTNTLSSTIWQYSVDPIGGQLTNPSIVAVTGAPFGIAINANSTFAYVVINDLNLVYQYSIDSLTGQLTQLPLLTKATGTTPRRIALSSDGKFAYVTNAGSNTISEYSIDPISGELTDLGLPTVTTGATPYFLALSPNGEFAYVNNSAGSSISQYSVNTVTGRLTALIPATVAAETNPRRIALTPNGMFLYATNNVSNTISQYSANLVTGHLTPLAPATVASTSPLGMAVSVNGRYVYISNNTASTLSQFMVN